MKHLT
jgi:DNA repair exonuclease SbcCD ATPase subunit